MEVKDGEGSGSLLKPFIGGEVGRQETGFARLPLSGQLGPGQLESTSFLCEREWTEVVFGCVYASVCVSERALHGCYFVFQTLARPWPEFGT